jgi:hypothetical protein
MENPEKPHELAEPIRHVAAITVLLNLTDEEIADNFQLSVKMLADWKQQPEWKEASAAFAKAQLVPWFKTSMTETPYSRQLTRRMILDLVRSAPARERFGRAGSLGRLLTVE